MSVRPGRTTSIRVTTATRGELRTPAEVDGVTLDQAIRQLLRAERQRRMGRELAAAPVEDDDPAWSDLAADGAAAGG